MDLKNVRHLREILVIDVNLGHRGLVAPGHRRFQAALRGQAPAHILGGEQGGKTMRAGLLLGQGPKVSRLGVGSALGLIPESGICSRPYLLAR